VGAEGSATDVAASTDIATSIKGELPGTNIETKLDRDVVNPYGISKNFILIGTSCTNKLIALITGKTFPSCASESGVAENSAIIKVYDGFTSGYYVLVVSGWDDSYTRIAASFLKKHDQYLSDKYVKAVKVTSESSSGITSYDETLSSVTTSTATNTILTSSTYLTSSVATSTLIISSSIMPTSSTDMSKYQEIIGQKSFLGIPIVVLIILSLAIFLILTIFMLFLFRRKGDLSQNY
jgi:hypothetical protein